MLQHPAQESGLEDCMLCYVRNICAPWGPPSAGFQKGMLVSYATMIGNHDANVLHFVGCAGAFRMLGNGAAWRGVKLC
jgi:hypothetical protein